MKNKWCLFYPVINPWLSSSKAVALNLNVFSYEEIETFLFSVLQCKKSGSLYGQ